MREYSGREVLMMVGFLILLVISGYTQYNRGFRYGEKSVPIDTVKVMIKEEPVLLYTQNMDLINGTLFVSRKSKYYGCKFDDVTIATAETLSDSIIFDHCYFLNCDMDEEIFHNNTRNSIWDDHDKIKNTSITF